MHTDQTVRGLQPNLATPRPRSREWIALFALIAAAIAVYSRVASFPYVAFDDPIFVSGNPPVLEGLTWNGIKWAFLSPHFSNWIPLTWLSFMLDMTIYRGWAGGLHITNVLLHLANAVLVYAILKRATGYSFRAMFVAALFAIHPLHVESVAWISERKDVLSIFFGLLSIGAYVRYTEQHGKRWYAFSFVAFACSLMSKQTLVTLPFLLVLLDGWPLGRLMRGAENPAHAQTGANSIGRRARIGMLVFEKVPFLVLTGVFCIVAVWSQASGNSIGSTSQFPIAVRCWNAVLCYGLYARKAFLPYDLAVFYPHPGAALNPAAVGLSLIFLIAVSAIAIAKARKWPFLIVGWFWFLGTFVPTIGFVQIGIQQMADRYAYFPLIGLYLAVAWIVPSIVHSARGIRFLPAIATGTVAVYATVAYFQVGTWENGTILMRHSLRVTEDSAFARAILADAMLDLGRTNEAFDELRHSVKIAPKDPLAHFRFGYVLEMLHRYDEAEELYRKSIELDDSSPNTHYRLAMSLIPLRRYDAAQDALLRSLELFEANALAHVHLARLLRAARQYELSITHCRRALELNGELLVCHRIIAHNLRDLGKVDEADDHLRIVVEADPTNSQVQAELSEILSLTASN